jgi:threonine dehydratase
VTVSLEDITQAAARIKDAIVRTPTIPAPGLSERFGAQVFLKLENMQLTGSFKERGALNRLLALDAASQAAGVVAASAGNHAQGVARMAARLNVPATIVMPTATPFGKVRRTEALGAKVVLHGDSLGDCEDQAKGLAARHGFTIIHPYDDDRVIAGQGTVALEMLAAVPDLDVMVVPIGGGGLIAGCAIAAKAIRPEIEMIGVEAALYPSMHHALRGLAQPAGAPTLAEGIAVKRPGSRTRPIVEALVGDILLVDEPLIEQAVQMLLDSAKVVAEGAGAAPLAALLADPLRFRGRRVGLVISGGNIDARLMASILMRGLIRDGRLVRFRVEVPDEPGRLAAITQRIGQLGGNLVEVIHQRWFHDVPVRLTEIDLMIETRDAAHMHAIMDALAAAGTPARVLSGTLREDDG